MLFLCSDCRRHIRDASCPFCGCANQVPPKTATALTPRRASRVAIVFGSVLTAQACYDDHGRSRLVADASHMQPPDDAAARADLGTPVGPGDAGPAVAVDARADAFVLPPEPCTEADYGGPPIGCPDAGATIAEYGGPPILDAGPGEADDATAPALLYGAAPFREDAS